MFYFCLFYTVIAALESCMSAAQFSLGRFFDVGVHTGKAISHILYFIDLFISVMLSLVLKVAYSK